MKTDFESSQKQFNETLRHQLEMDIMIERQDYNLFALLKPDIYMDGNQWCVSYGEKGNPMEAIQGFGNSPYLAILDFNKSFYSELKQAP